MKDNEGNKLGDWNPVTMMRAAVIALMVCLFIALLCAGCSPRVVETVVVRTDTLIQTRVEKDSVVMRDSVWVNQTQRGDTVWVEKVKWVTKWENHLAHDTLYISKTDTVRVKDVVVKEVKKPLVWWQKLLIWVGSSTLVFFIIFIVIGIIRFMKMRREFFL